MWKDMEEIQLNLVRLSLRGNMQGMQELLRQNWWNHRSTSKYICKLAFKNSFLLSFAIQLL